MKRKQPSKSANNYLKYSGIALQLFALILIALLGGQWLDDKLEHTLPIFTLAFIVVALIGFFYKLIKDLERDK